MAGCQQQQPSQIIQKDVPGQQEVRTASSPTTVEITTNIAPTNESASIQIDYPAPNSTIVNPLTITGKAKGSWFFEATFPVKLVDENGKEITAALAHASEDWMTEDFVFFTAEMTFDAVSPGSGKLVFSKDNPSGLPENDESFELPVIW